MNNDKIKPLVQAARPSNVTELKCFLGAVTFYSKFLRNLSQTAYPLNRLLKQKIEWKWTQECEDSFIKIKDMLKKPPILSNYDHNSNITVITDASPTGLGAILTTGKHERPVIFVS